MIPRTLRNHHPRLAATLATPAPRAHSIATPQLRLSAVVRQLSTSSASSSSPMADGTSGSGKPSGGGDELPVLFRSDPRSESRTFILNRPAQLNALDQQMLELLKPAIEEWEKEPRCRMIIGTGNGRAFCAGIVKNLIEGNPEVGIRFFKEEFELDYALASLRTPYVAILDGMTMGGGVGLSINAMFRVATENTVFAMPETKIGYSPDVGASFFLPRLDGALGAYLGLTGESLRGREVFEAGIATHFVESAQVPALLDRLDSLADADAEKIDETIEAFSSSSPSSSSSQTMPASRRKAVDKAFSGDTVEAILDALRKEVEGGAEGEQEWARKTLDVLEERSPTSLRVALEVLRRGKNATLERALGMELGIATAYCRGASPDFVTGVKALLMDKVKGRRPEWSPNKLADAPLGPVLTAFFDEVSGVPRAAFLEAGAESAAHGVKWERNPMRFCLPSEEEIGKIVRGEHKSSGATAFSSVEELVEVVRRLWKGKQGVEAKVRDVVERRCEVVPEKGDTGAYLRWIH